MMKTERGRQLMGVAVAAWLGTCLAAPAMTAEALREAMASGEKVTVVDLRLNHEYQEGHIPGAINISYVGIEKKSVPPLGKVVAYCDGLGANYAEACVAALNAKPGIRAEALDGGYAAWQTLAGQTTQAAGMKPGSGVEVITYEKLVASGGKDMIVVDLCKGGHVKGDGKGQAGAGFSLTSFCQNKLPGANVTRNADGYLKRHGTGLLVLVDDDNETAERQARLLRATGYKRVVVLAGGLEILKREGRTGSKRIGSSIGLTDEGVVREAEAADGGETTDDN